MESAPATIKVDGVTLHRERDYGCGFVADDDKDFYTSQGIKAVVRRYDFRSWVYIEKNGKH